MALLNYYFPSDRPLTPAILAATDFDPEYIRLAELPGREVTQGPDGQRGYCFLLRPDGLRCPPQTTQIPGYYPDSQSWYPWSAATPTVWFGWRTKEQSDCFSPLRLARAYTVAGHFVKWRDGNLWQVPIVRRPAGQSTLPTVLGWSAAGELIREKAPEYATLWEKTLRAWDGFAGLSADPLTYEDAFALIAMAVDLNYRIKLPELAATRLIGANIELTESLNAIFDVPGWEACIKELEEKKTETASEVLGS